MIRLSVVLIFIFLVNTQISGQKENSEKRHNIFLNTLSETKEYLKGINSSKNRHRSNSKAGIRGQHLKANNSIDEKVTKAIEEKLIQHINPKVIESETISPKKKNKPLGTQAIPLAQRAVLITLYNSTDGDNWDNNSGWKTPPLDADGFAMPGTENTWEGITIEADQIIEIDLSWNNLTGTIPAEIGSLSNLTDLDLSENNLSGIIPAELGNLNSLQRMYLSNNVLSGSIPAGLADPGDLPNLFILDFSDNNLSGNIPASLGNLGSLVYLYLVGNQLDGNIPPELGSIGTLIRLFLSENLLSGSIPPELGNLGNLEYLILDNNSLSGSIPSELGNLNSLSFMDLSINELSGTIPAGLADPEDLPNILLIDFSDNNLSGNIPPSLGNLSSLMVLSFMQNQLDGNIPPQLGDMDALRRLYLGENELTGSIPSGLMDTGDLPQLQILDLCYNHLSGAIPNEIGNLTNLQMLGITGNMFSGEIPSGLLNLNNLVDGYSDFCFNSIYTTNPVLKTFIDSKQYYGDWESTQTIAPKNFSSYRLNSVSYLRWNPILYTGDTGGYDIYYSSNSGGPYSLLYSTPDKSTSSYDCSSLPSGSSYYFRFKSRTEPHAENDNVVISEYSTEIFVGSINTSSYPMVKTNIKAVIPEGGQLKFTDAVLEYYDDDAEIPTLKYTIIDLPQNGALSLNGTILTREDDNSFTQNDITYTKVVYTHDGGEARMDSITFTVSDIEGHSTGIEKFFISISNVNDPPVISAIQDQTIKEDSSLTIFLSASDVEKDSITYTTTSDTGAVTVITADTTLTLRGAVNWNGSANITVIAADGIDSDTTSFRLTITPVNDSPVVDSLANITMNEDEIKEIIIEANDVDGDSLTYSAVSSDSNVSVNMNRNKLTIVPIKNWFGTSEITVTVSDTSLSTNASFTLEVISINDAPVLSNIETSVLKYVIKAEGLSITDSLQITDIDNVNLKSAEISFDEKYIKGEDKLIFDKQNGITGKWSMESGTMRMTGTATLADYKSAITNVQYINSFITPTGSIRTVNISVSDSEAVSNSVSRQIIIAGKNAAPILSNVETEPIRFVKGDGGKVITSTVKVEDPDNKYLFEGKVSFGEGFISGEDEFEFENTSLITGNYEASSGSLLLTGMATPEEYQNALRTIKYKNTKGVKAITSTKKITFTVRDGQLLSNQVLREIEVVSPLLTPSNLTLEVNDKWEVVLNWEDNSNNEDGFVIGKVNGSIGQQLMIVDTIDANITEYFDNGVIEGSHYTYGVLAYNNLGAISDTTSDNRNLILIPLKPPTDLKAVASPEGKIDLSWTNNSLADITFIIERSDEVDNNFKELHKCKKDSTKHCDNNIKNNCKYYYRVYGIKDSLKSEFSNVVEVVGIITDVTTNMNGIPTEHALYNNYPNPFNPTTIISYDLPSESNVRLSVYNILGEEIAVLINTNQLAGRYKIKWDASKTSSGIYFYRIYTSATDGSGNFTRVMKMLLMK